VGEMTAIVGVLAFIFVLFVLVGVIIFMPKKTVKEEKNDAQNNTENH
jgi:hypothetical protein